MEHRCGKRHVANLPVSFTLQSGQRGVGRVLNISTTGAYVQTEIPLRILTLIDLLIDGVIPRGARFTGCVMRRDQGGVGLEWQAPIPSDLMRNRSAIPVVHLMSNRAELIRPAPEHVLTAV